MARARTIVLWALTVEVAVLAVTGVALYFAYRPDAAQAWADVGGSLSRDVTVGGVLRDLHQWAAWLALPTAVVAGVLLAVPARVAERVGPGVALAAGLVVAVAAAQVTGLALPWDQLGLWAVTVGTNISGYTWLRDDTVRFALMDGTEIAPVTLLKWLVLHVAVGTLVGGLTALGWRRARAGGAPDAPPTAVAAEPDGVAVTA